LHLFIVAERTIGSGPRTGTRDRTRNRCPASKEMCMSVMEETTSTGCTPGLISARVQRTLRGPV
jgi:hypothetical protein